MSGHLVFVRFFLDFTPDFPAHRFDHLSTDALGRAFEAVAREWLRDPDNQKRFRVYEAEQEKLRAETNDLRRRWNRWVRGDARSLAEILIPKRTGKPGFWEVAEAAGWTCPKGFGTSHGVSERWPVAWYEPRPAADLAAAALNARLGEHSRATYKKDRWSDDDRWRATNPRFFVVAEADLSRVEVVAATERLRRMAGPVVGSPTLEEGILRLFWPMIGPTLEQVDATPSEAAAELKALRSLVGTLGLKGIEAKTVIAICEGQGRVPVADLVKRFEWSSPTDDWNSARKRLNAKFKGRGWQFATKDGHAIAVQHPTRRKMD